MDWLGAGPSEGSEGMLVQSIADAVGWGLVYLALVLAILLVLLVERVCRRRRFWCAQVGREVDVEFEEAGLPGFRHPVAVRGCTEFDPPTAIACNRRCLDANLRARLPMRPPLRWR